MQSGSCAEQAGCDKTAPLLPVQRISTDSTASQYPGKFPVLPHYQDYRAVPLQEGLSRGAASALTLLGYIVGAAAFTTTVLAFLLLEATMTESTYIASAMRPGDACEILSKVTGESTIREYNADFWTEFQSVVGVPLGTIAAAHSTTFDFNSGPDWVALQYNARFTSYEQCLNKAHWECQAFEPDASGGLGFLPCAVRADSGLIRPGQAFGRTDGALRFGSGCTDCQGQQFRDSVAAVLQAYYTPAMFCEPLKEFPPYLCTSKQRKSALEIISQSVAIFSGALSAFAAITALLLPMCKRRAAKAMPISSVSGSGSA